MDSSLMADSGYQMSEIHAWNTQEASSLAVRWGGDYKRGEEKARGGKKANSLVGGDIIRFCALSKREAR